MQYYRRASFLDLHLDVCTKIGAHILDISRRCKLYDWYSVNVISNDVDELQWDRYYTMPMYYLSITINWIFMRRHFDTILIPTIYVNYCFITAIIKSKGGYCFLILHFRLIFNRIISRSFLSRAKSSYYFTNCYYHSLLHFSLYYSGSFTLE